MTTSAAGAGSLCCDGYGDDDDIVRLSNSTLENVVALRAGVRRVEKPDRVVCGLTSARSLGIPTRAPCSALALRCVPNGQAARIAQS